MTDALRPAVDFLSRRSVPDPQAPGDWLYGWAGWNPAQRVRALAGAWIDGEERSGADPATTTLQFVGQGENETGSGHADRVAHGNGAAVRVDLLRIQAEFLGGREADGRERLVDLDDVEVGTRQVTNAEWVRFIDDGGYARPDLWLSDGWATLQATGWDAPGYWRPDDDHGWTTFTLSGRRPVVAAEPMVPNVEIVSVSRASAISGSVVSAAAAVRLPRESSSMNCWSSQGL